MKPKRTPDIETKMLPDGHVVIFSKSSDWAHTITPLAAIAWEYCDGEHSVDEIVERVLQFASGDVQNLQPAISDLLTDFEQSGLIADATA
ncbi:hypothetical protein BH10CYA1_BH10CYA1_55260 [soil metagenome]